MIVHYLVDVPWDSTDYTHRKMAHTLSHINTVISICRGDLALRIRTPVRLRRLSHTRARVLRGRFYLTIFGPHTNNVQYSCCC